MKVVLDTNVLVSSFFGGHPRKIVNLWKTGEITLCLSKGILDEYVEVLGRLGLQNEKELGELLGLFARGFHVQFTAKTPDLRIVEGDPDDDKFIECAVALNAKIVISGDKVLKAIEKYMGIEIFTPREFLEIFIKPQR
jgi:putative PIN family toxin of toxin-antitoxin system